MDKSEHDLEQALLNNIPQVLLEFGNGFAFVAHQQKILIADQWEKIDLLFYHR
jgi:predicted nuclease of restriction endonuclease-like (RecB) superfamily